VPFMENNNMWHYTRLDTETYAQALAAVAGCAA
jgi:transketolase